MKDEDNQAGELNRGGSTLTDLRVGNFKAFADVQHLPIKPITLIFGANSSGKSSLIHSLLLAHHALAHGNVDVHQPRLAGQSVDLGGFREFVHQHEVDRSCHFEFALRHPKPWEFAEMLGPINNATLGFEIGREIHADSEAEQTGLVGVSSFALKLEGVDFLRADRGQDGNLRIVSVNFTHPSLGQLFDRINQIRPPESKYRQPLVANDAEDFGQIKETCKPFPTAGDERLRVEMEKALDLERDAAEGRSKNQESERKIRADFLGELETKLKNYLATVPLRPANLVPVSKRRKEPRIEYFEQDSGYVWRELGMPIGNETFFKRTARYFAIELEELLDQLSAELNQCLESMTYLGPLRCYPPRHLVGMHDQDPNWFSGGGHAWDRLRSDEKVREKVNHWLGSFVGRNARYEIRKRCLTDLEQVSDITKKRIADRLKLGVKNEAEALTTVEALQREIASDPTGSVWSELVLVDKRTGLVVSHRDVGVGISQVLPVLVHAYADNNQVVAIEQPEIHLHPALQAELGDVFIAGALGERRNTFILETHSEHLILRIMRRMRETFEKRLPEGRPPVCPSDVAILYVEADGSRSIVREMALNEAGQLVKAWPGGFFEEGFREVFS
jgi:hypothetical protein